MHFAALVMHGADACIHDNRRALEPQSAGSDDQMGYSINWIAVKADSPAAVWDRIGVTGSGRYDGRLALSGAMLPSGWYLMIYDHDAINVLRDRDYCRQPDMDRLSDGFQVISCDINETIMWQSAEAWEDGEEKWSVMHNAEEGIYDLTVTGDAPDILDAIKTKYIEQQDAEGGEDADVDFISEIPLALAKEITGYKHDEHSPELAQVQFEELVAAEISVPVAPEPPEQADPETLRQPEPKQPGLWASLGARLGFGPRR